MSDDETTNPFEPPQSETFHLYPDDSVNAFRDGSYLVVSKPVMLPSRCVLCNKPAAGSLRQHVYATAKAMRRFAVAGLIAIPVLIGGHYATKPFPQFRPMLFQAFTFVLAIVVPLALQHRDFHVRFGMCGKHLWILRLGRFLFVVWISLVCLLGALHEVAATKPYLDGMSKILLVICLSAVLLQMKVRFHPKISRREGSRIWVSGCGEDFLSSLPMMNESSGRGPSKPTTAIR